MITIGTPLSASATKVMMLGSGELGKEVVLEFQRYGAEVIAIDSYENAPAMQIAHKSHVISMLNGDALRKVIELEKPDYIIPEIEAIATDTLVELEKEGFNIIPTAKATLLTMNREGIRTLAAEDLGLTTSPYKFAGTKEEYITAIKEIGMPCIIKPVMSSSGKGQSTVKTKADIDKSWAYAKDGARGSGGRVIIEGFVDFDYEITLLTISHINGISFCAPIGHRQEDGDYQESWQPQTMSEKALAKAQHIAGEVVKALGGRGLFGVEFFIKGDKVYFSELSPRPHDTGMVTMISQNLSEFALHTRAILGIPIPNITLYKPAASSVILAKGVSKNIVFSGIEKALTEPDTQLRFFGKPEVNGKRRMGVCLALGTNTDNAREIANKASNAIKIQL